MIKLTQEQEDKLANFQQDAYSLKGWLTYKDDTVFNFEDACFRAIKTCLTLKQLADSKTITFEIQDNLTPVLRRAGAKISSKKVCQEFVDDLIECGIVTTVVTLSKSNILLSFDTDTTSAREVFFVGNIVRTIQNWPAIVYDYFKLKEMYPDIEKWKLFYIAHLVPLGNYRIFMNSNHCHLDFSFFGYLLDSPSITLEKIRGERWGTLKTYQGFNHNLNGVFVALQPTLGKQYVSKDSSEYRVWYSYRKDAYKNKAVDSVVTALLNEEAFTSFINSEEFKSYTKPKGDW
jgi:hypothetical protein